MDFVTSFFGRFHPLLVHLPIGILLLAFLFECLSLRKSYKGLRKAIQPALLWGSISAIAAAISGFFLRQEGGYEQALADLHQNFGIATAVLCLVVYVVRARMKYWINDRLKRKQLRILLFLPLIVLLSITGHWGGSLTHGEDYLFSAMTLSAQEPLDPRTRIGTIINVEEAVLYDHVIQPILEARCYDCHSSRKQKGDLRLDKIEYIIRGGKDGEVISAGPADSSSLYNRLVLPIEDEDHMPPGEKPQLSSSEIALIKYWVEEQANFEKTIDAFQNHAKIAAIIRSLQEAPRESWIPTRPVDAASNKTIAKLRSLKVLPMPLAEGNNYLMVTFTGAQKISDEQLSALQEINDQLVWLNLGHTPVTDTQLDGVAKLSNLRVLYLNNTDVSDAGLAKLAPLVELRWLSLVGTNITDTSIPTFEKFKNLTNLFLFQTKLTDQGIADYSAAHDEVKIDTGNYRLEELPTDTIVYKKVTSKK